MPDKNPDSGPHMAAQDLLRHTRPPGLKRWGVIVAVVAVVIAVVGIGLRLMDRWRTAAWTDEQAVQSVQVIKLDAPEKGGVLNLPGDIQAFTTAQIHAQVTGYVKKWYVDIERRPCLTRRNHRVHFLDTIRQRYERRLTLENDRPDTLLEQWQIACKLDGIAQTLLGMHQKSLIGKRRAVP